MINNLDLTNNGRKLPLVEEFYTLQGEGYWYGTAAYFIRVGGCDIACHWCDSKYSWNADFDNLVEIDNIIRNIQSNNADTVVVTGGEPLNYNLNYLCEKLHSNKIKTFLETSGSLSLSGQWDWICLSPKKNFPPVQQIYHLANELKVIIHSDDDFQWAEYNSQIVNSNCRLFLQPEWGRRKEMTARIVEYIKKNTKWHLSLQVHKFINIP